MCPTLASYLIIHSSGVEQVTMTAEKSVGQCVLTTCDSGLGQTGKCLNKWCITSFTLQPATLNKCDLLVDDRKARQPDLSYVLGTCPSWDVDHGRSVDADGRGVGGDG